MKINYILTIMLFMFTITLFSQENKDVKIIYINQKDFKVTKSNDEKTVLQTYLRIKKGCRFDCYYFILQTDFKDFDKSEVLLENENFELLSKSDLKKMAPCDLHEFFSNQNNIKLLVYKKDNKYYGWYLFYDGTTKKTVRIIPKV